MIRKVKGSLPHIHWMDLNSDGVMIECAILSEDSSGNIMFIQVDRLDSIDKNRLVSIITSRQAEALPLWDCMATRTLGNGVNALEYFHQLVKTLTPSGKILKPQLGRRGVEFVADTQVQATPGKVTPAAQAVRT